MSRVGKRYAKALFGLALERHCLEDVETDLNQIAGLLETNSDFGYFLSNPLVGDQERFAIVKEVFEGKVQALTYQFLNLLADKKRLNSLPDVVVLFRQMLLQHRQVVEGELISAVELDANQVTDIKKQMEVMIGKTVELTKRLDPEILGGFVLRFEDVVIDNSVRNQLMKLREKLIAG